MKTGAESPTTDEAGRATSAGNLSPQEMEGLTLYEKKCVLINHELDNNGMGRCTYSDGWNNWRRSGTPYEPQVLYETYADPYTLHL